MTVKKQFLKSKPVVKVTFEVSKQAAGEAQQVFLLCESNDWQRTPLKQLKDGRFKVTVDLPTDDKDDFEYRFCKVMADGSEVFDNDWEAEIYRPGPFGSDNSVVTVSA